MHTQRRILLLLAAASLFVFSPSANAYETTPQSHHAVCQAVPHMIVGGTYEWAAIGSPGHGGRPTGTLRRDGVTGTSNILVTAIDANPALPAAALRMDGLSTWHLRVGVAASWHPDLAAGADPSDVRLLVHAQVRLGDAPVGEAEAIQTVAPALSVLSSGPPPSSVLLGGENYFEGTFAFEFRPDHVPSGQNGTLDEVNVRLFLQLAAPDPVGLPGTATVPVFLTQPGPGHLGTMFEAPGDCGPATTDASHHHHATSAGPKEHDASAQTSPAAASKPSVPPSGGSGATSLMPEAKAAPDLPGYTAYGGAGLASLVGLAGITAVGRRNQR